jgi:ribosomal protein S20
MENKREPQPGDLIWANRMAKGLPYNHCGIYEGGGHVIHFAAPEGSETNPENAVVHETRFEHFADGCDVSVIDIEGSKSPEETLRLARSCIGMKGYAITSSNCDHFATWCKTGKYHSIQVDKVKNILREMGGPIAGLVCEVHDIVEMIKAPRLDTVYPEKKNEILDTVETNAYVTEADPPVPDEENDIQADYELIKEARNSFVEEVDKTSSEDEYDEDDKIVKNDEQEDGEPPRKRSWYEKVGNVLKGLTYPVSGALEFLKRIGNVPIIKNIDFVHLGAKVRNVIDNVVNTIKVFTGRMTRDEAVEERMNNETALAGMIIAAKQVHSVSQTLRNVFGKVGSVVKHVVQQAVTRVVPASVRSAIKTGARKIGTAVVSGVKSFAQKATTGVKSFLGSVKSFFRGKTT